MPEVKSKSQAWKSRRFLKFTIANLVVAMLWLIAASYLSVSRGGLLIYLQVPMVAVVVAILAYRVHAIVTATTRE